MGCSRDLYSLKWLVLVIEAVKAYHLTALDHCSYRLPDKSQHYDDNMASQIAKRAQRLEVQTKAKTFNVSDPISIFGFLNAIQITGDITGLMKVQ